MRIFEQLESRVRGYVRSFPVIFESSEGVMMTDESGRSYIDFFAGAGTLNYGHNNERINAALIEYINNKGPYHTLDMATTAKKKFLTKFNDTILLPKNLDYKVQFTGPTGTNSVETAIKLARMIKGRSNIVAFTNGFHGLTMGSLSITGNNFYRDESYISRSNVSFMPYDNYLGPELNTMDYFRKFLSDNSSGLDLPAAVIVECIQAEGGVNVASAEWLRELAMVCYEYDILLIIDDIQVGNGRTGEFFSFEDSGIKPDMVTMAKAIGGGLPMALLLFRSDLDYWKPGEHTGTFRGNNLAFVAAYETLHYWDSMDLSNAVKYKAEIMKEKITAIAEKYPQLNAKVRGRGMIWGLEIPERGFCSEVSERSFENGLVIELAGADDQVVKFLPPLIIDEETLLKGISIVEQSIGELVDEKKDKLTEEIV